MIKLLILSVISVSLWSSITIKPQSVNEVKKTEIKLSLKGAFQKGNTEKENIVIGANMVAGDGENYKHLFIGSYSIGSSNEIEDTNKGLFHYRFTHLIGNDYDYEFFTQEEFNKFQNTKMRFLVGSNIRKRLPFAKRLFIGSGIMYSNVSPDEVTVIDLDKKKIKLNLYMSFNHKFSNSFELNSMLFYQPTVYNINTEKSMQFNDYRLNSKNSFISKITKKLSFTTNFDYSYHSKPFLGIEKDDLKLTVGLELKI